MKDAEVVGDVVQVEQAILDEAAVVSRECGIRLYRTPRTNY